MNTKHRQGDQVSPRAAGSSRFHHSNTRRAAIDAGSLFESTGTPDETPGATERYGRKAVAALGNDQGPEGLFAQACLHHQQISAESSHLEGNQDGGHHGSTAERRIRQAAVGSG